MRYGDPQFDKLLLSLNLICVDSMEADKRILFNYVCIVFRFILYIIVLLLHDNKYLPYVMLILSLFAALNLSNSLYNGNNSQWWSKKFQLFIAIALFIVSMLLIFDKVNNTFLIPIILFTSLFVGIFESILAN